MLMRTWEKRDGTAYESRNKHSKAKQTQHIGRAHNILVGREQLRPTPCSTLCWHCRTLPEAYSH